MKNMLYDTWYKIPHFNGYEIQISLYHQGYRCYYDTEKLFYFRIRSYKNFNKYPYGYLLPYDHKAKGKMIYYYEMTDHSNKRKRLTLDNILNYIANVDYGNTDINYYQRNLSSRNNIIVNPNAINFGDSMRSGCLFKKEKPKMKEVITFLPFTNNNR